jgi:hypothetical protein
MPKDGAFPPTGHNGLSAAQAAKSLPTVNRGDAPRLSLQPDVLDQKLFSSRSI